MAGNLKITIQISVWSVLDTIRRSLVCLVLVGEVSDSNKLDTKKI